MRFESCIFAVWYGVNWHDVGCFLDRLSRSLRRPQDLLLFQSASWKLSSASDVSLHAAACNPCPHYSIHITETTLVPFLLVLPTHRWQVLCFSLHMMYLIIMDSGICCMFYVIGWFLSARAVFTTWQLMLLDIKISLKNLLSYPMVLCTRFF